MRLRGAGDAEGAKHPFPLPKGCEAPCRAAQRPEGALPAQRMDMEGFAPMPPTATRPVVLASEFRWMTHLLSDLWDRHPALLDEVRTA